VFKLKSGLASYWFKTTTLYGLLALGFSLLGFLPYLLSPPDAIYFDMEESIEIGQRITVQHILGHIAWGSVAAFATLRLKYIMAGGLFGIALDGDHIVDFLNIDILSRMGHSLPFAFLIPIAMMLVFGRKDLLLGAIAISAVFTHLSFDTFSGGGVFPLLAPFIDQTTTFEGIDWVMLQLIAVGIVIVSKLIVNRKVEFRKHFFWQMRK